TYLFEPAVAYRVREGNEEGTPLPLDEPQADNPAVGVNVEYYLADAARTPVVIDVLDAGGRTERHFSSAEKPKPVDPQSVDYTTHWIAVQHVPEATAGAHRFVWDFREGSEDGLLVPPGRYTIRLTVNGKSYTRTSVVRRDPRAPATDADLQAQYELAREVQGLRDEVRAARKRSKDAASTVAPSVSHDFMATIVGVPPKNSPDDSIGVYSHDVTSFLYLDTSLGNLINAIESADAPPTPDMRSAFRKLEALYGQTLQRQRTMQTMR
ncbi:MAG TPA: hypothetical protein VEJ20_08470, partial [Candidatus Eremiobacteraceae bacterium]|nr:hypothetical protein [Candidatus Eremiobacteraceae bacterium]